MIKPIAQENHLGCGVACIAFLLGKTYKETLAMFPDGIKKANTIGFYSKELALKLNTYYKVGFVKRNRKYIHKTGSIVFMRRGSKYKCGHFVVRWENKWMDPWINFPLWPPQAGFRKRLPEKVVYIIFQVT